MTRRCTRLGAVAATVAVLATGCTGGTPDPEAALVEALDRTLSGPVAYRFGATADPDALEGLGQGAPAAAAFLGGFEVVGAVAEDDLAATVRILGADVLQVVRRGEATSVRLGLSDLPGVPAQLTDPVRLLPVVRQLGLGDAAETAFVTLLQGGWLTIAGELTLDGLRAATGVEASGAVAPSPFDGGLGDTIRRYADVTQVTDAEDRTTYRIEVRLRELVGAVTRAAGAVPDQATDGSAIPQVLPGSVIVRDGVVTRIRLDVTDLTADGAAEGRVELELELDEHGRAVVRDAPDPAATLSAEAFLEALATVLRFAGGLGVG